MSRRVVEHIREATPRILWHNLKGEKVIILRERIGLGHSNMYKEDVDHMWNQVANIIRNVARDLLGVTSGKVQDQKEAWWWNEKVKVRVKAKQYSFRGLIGCQEDEQIGVRKTLYKEAMREVKKAVAEAKCKVYEAMYKCLDTKEGENGIYKLSKTRERRRCDLGFVWFIKDEDERVLVMDGDIKCRWYNYFQKLFNKV